MVTITKVRGVLWHTVSTKLQYCWQSNWSDVGRSRRYRNSEIRYNFTDRYLLSQFDVTCTRIITFFVVTFNYCYQNEYFDGFMYETIIFSNLLYNLCWTHHDLLGSFFLFQLSGHQKRILLAIKRIEDINQGRRPNLLPQPCISSHMNSLVRDAAAFQRPSTLSNFYYFVLRIYFFMILSLEWKNNIPKSFFT